MSRSARFAASHASSPTAVDESADSDDQEPNTKRCRIDQDEDECGICLQQLPPVGIQPGKTRMRMICCGKELCTSCDSTWEASWSATTVPRCPYCRGSLPSTEDEKLALIRAKAMQGKSWALLMLGDAYRDGSDMVEGKENVHEAAKMYRLAVLQDMRLDGGARAAYGLGQLYFHGAGVERSIDVAIEWYSKGHDAGDVWSTYALGICFRQDSHLDEQKSFSLWLEAAEAGVPQAQTDVGWSYANGKGVPQSHAQAIQWYAKSSRQGNAIASLKLSGILYGHDEDGEETDNETLLAAFPTIMALTRAVEGRVDESRLAYGRGVLRQISTMCACCRVRLPHDQGHWCGTCRAAMYCSERCMELASARHRPACDARNRFLPAPKAAEGELEDQEEEETEDEGEEEEEVEEEEDSEEDDEEEEDYEDEEGEEGHEGEEGESEEDEEPEAAEEPLSEPSAWHDLRRNAPSSPYAHRVARAT